MRQRPGAIHRTREGLSKGSVSTREGEERIGPRQDAQKAATAWHSALRSPSPPRRNASWARAAARAQTGSRVGMQQGIQATDDSSVMPSGVRSRILRRQCAQRVLCTRGSTERQQQPRNLSVGKGMQGAASGRGGPSAWQARFQGMQQRTPVFQGVHQVPQSHWSYQRSWARCIACPS